MTAEAFRRTGGIPDIPLGEDRGFFDALRRVDATIRHAPDVSVTVSGRTIGRACGGMADTIRRRLAAPDVFLDDALEPVTATMRRACLRARARTAWHHPPENDAMAALAADGEVTVTELQDMLDTPFFGTAWARLESCCPSLARGRIRAANVGRETARARQLLSALRISPARRTSPFDTFQPADAQPA